MCNKGVPLQNGDQSLNVAVSNHIDCECKSDRAVKKRPKVYSNKCSVILCKQSEAVEVKCDQCLKTFCLKHRFPDDHKCQRFKNTSQPIISTR